MFIGFCQSVDVCNANCITDICLHRISSSIIRKGVLKGPQKGSWLFSPVNIWSSMSEFFFTLCGLRRSLTKLLLTELTLISIYFQVPKTASNFLCQNDFPPNIEAEYLLSFNSWKKVRFRFAKKGLSSADNSIYISQTRLKFIDSGFSIGMECKPNLQISK